MKFLLVYILILQSLILFSQTETEKLIKQFESQLQIHKDSQISLQKKLEVFKLKWIGEQIQSTALPKINKDGFLIHHSAMSLFYSPEHEQAWWVVHMILPDIKTGVQGRTNDFRQDSLVKFGTADKNDYYMSGYDRGHLAPSADFRWSKRALSESYYYSNMSPQRPEFNRGKWADLEDFGRQYVLWSQHPIFVVTGGVLTDSLKSIGVDKKISIPKYYYKIFMDLNDSSKKAIGFIMRNGINTYPIINYSVTIDSIETLTGIDFFPLLQDSVENRLEKMNDVNFWLEEKSAGIYQALNPEEIPQEAINTIQAKGYIGEKKTVCGTVVSTRVWKDNKAVFMNLDQKFPNHVFSATIWGNSLINFSYEPASTLINKKVCITGIIGKYKEVPSMEIKNEKAIQFIEDFDD